MLPYFTLLMLPSLFAIFNSYRLSLPLWYATFFIFVFFIGLRFQVGPDWVQYGLIHTTVAYYSLWEVVTQAEPLSYLLFWFSQNAGLHVYLSNVVAALIMMIGVFSFARRTSNPWLALVAATPYFIIVMGMSGVRQTMAAGIVLFLFAHWERYSFISRFFYILVAAMFHTSALVNNIFLITKLNFAMRYKIILGSLMAILTLYLSFEVSVYSENVLRYQQRYLEGSFLTESFGSIYHIAMIMIPAALGLLFKKRIVKSIHSEQLLNFGLYSAVGVFIINFFYSTVASRLTIYLYFLPMMIYPALVTSFGRRAQQMSVFVIIGVHIVILLGWFMLGNHAFAYLPYQNVLFDE